VLLNGRLELYGVDAEKFSASVLHRQLRRRGATLRPDQLEEALAHLVGELWRLSERFDPARGLDFDGYAGKWLPRALDDWYRARFVDRRYTYGNAERRDAIAFAESLDEVVGFEDRPLCRGDSIAADPEQDQLAAALERGSFNSSIDWTTVGRGLYANGDSERASDLAEIRRLNDQAVPGGTFATERARAERERAA
jgi:hypothetical protein